MRKTFAAILAALSAWLLLLSFLLMGVFFCTTSKGFYRYEYQKYGQAQAIGIDDEGLMRITNGLLDYLWGTRDTLEMQAEIGGQMREVFSQREKDHMVDVKALVGLARTAMVGALVAGATLWTLAYFLGKKRKGGVRAAGVGYLVGAGLLVAGVCAVVFLALENFTSVFIRFHEIFFTNDLWLLNADDMLIMMVPEPFFADCAALIAIAFGVGAALTCAGAVLMILWDGKRPRRGNREEDWTLTAVGGGDGDNFYKISSDGQPQERPDASEIFARMGLEGEEDEEETMPVERLLETAREPETQMPRPIAPPAPLPHATEAGGRRADFLGEFPVRLESEDLTVRFEMKLDLKVEKNEDGQLSLVMDPRRKPQVSLTSLPGQLAFTVSEAPAADWALEAGQAEEVEAARQRVSPLVEPAPTPEDLLRQMDELMKGFPKSSGEEGVQ